MEMAPIISTLENKPGSECRLPRTKMLKIIKGNCRMIAAIDTI